LNSEVDDNIIREFLEYYSETKIPDPEHYPKIFKFMVDAFMHHKRMLAGEQV